MNRLSILRLGGISRYAAVKVEFGKDSWAIGGAI